MIFSDFFKKSYKFLFLLGFIIMKKVPPKDEYISLSHYQFNSWNSVQLATLYNYSVKMEM